MRLVESVRDEIDGARKAGITVEPMSGLTESDISALEQRFGALSSESRELLLHFRGFEIRNPAGRLPTRLDVAEDYNFGWEALPRGFPVASDGFGNTWVADASTRNGDWGPILFVSHDPPVLVGLCL